MHLILKRCTSSAEAPMRGISYMQLLLIENDLVKEA